MKKGFCYFLAICLLISLLDGFLTSYAMAVEEDFWGGPTTPFTKPTDPEVINNWGTPLQRKFSRVVTHAIYDSVWNMKEWNEFGAEHNFSAFMKSDPFDQRYPQSVQILEPDDPSTSPPKTKENFYMSPSRPFKRFIDKLHVQNNLITGGVDCDLSDIRDSWWLRFYSDVYWRPGKINLQSENGRKYVIHYALAQVAAGCDTVWYYRRLLDANKQSPFSLQNWAALIKETKDYVQRAYGRDILVSGIGAYNKYVDYQVDPLIEYFYCPNNNPYEGRPMFLTKKGVPYQDISNRAGFSKVYHLDCSQSKLSYLHMITFSRGISPRDSFRSGAWAQEDLKAAGFKYSGPKGDGTTYGIPILAFVDWPTPLSDLTTNIPEEEQMNFFYGMVPEMMAVGWRFCFPLSTYLRKENGTGALMMDVGEILNGESQESQAAKTSIYYKLRKLIDFYNYHSSFYQQQVVQWNEDPVEHDLKKIHAVDVTMTNVKNISYVVNEYRDKPFLLSVHLINHYYKDYAIQEQADFYIEVPIKFKPLSVGMVSPDSIDYKEAKQLSFSYNTGNVTIRIPNITYYNLILIEGRPFTPTEEKEAFSIANYLSTPESKSEGAFSSGSIVDSIDSKGSEIFNYLSNDQISTD